MTHNNSPPRNVSQTRLMSPIVANLMQRPTARRFTTENSFRDSGFHSSHKFYCQAIRTSQSFEGLDLT